MLIPAATGIIGVLLTGAASGQRRSWTRAGRNYYAEAITWLEEVRDAYLLDGREEAWREYLDELIECHQRKYKLRPMLEDLAR